MWYTSGQADNRGGGQAADLAAIAEWLGTRVGVLRSPASRSRTVGRTSDTTVANSQGQTRDLGSERPGDVRVAHDLLDGTTAAVVTARDDQGGASLIHHMWAAIIDYQLGQFRRSGPPWGAGPPPSDVEHRLDTNKPPEPTGTRTVVVDGVELTWDEITERDLATAVPIAVCGGRIGNSVIAVTGRAASLRNLAVELWPTHPGRNPGT